MNGESKFKIVDRDDGELWENGTYGESEEHMKRAPLAIDKAIDDSLGLVQVTIRLQKDLVEQLKRIACENGLGYQPYVRQVLTQHAQSKAKEPVASK